MFTGRLSDKVKYKTIKIEDGKLTILPPDAPIEAGAEVYNAT